MYSEMTEAPQKKPALIATLITVALIVATVALWFGVAHGSPGDYEVVKVKVLSGETRYEERGKTIQAVHEIKVSYEGEIYQLQNLHSTWQYSVGQTVDAYLSNGVLYANIEGVTSSGPLATVYFVFLGLSFAGVVTSTTLFSSYRKKKRYFDAIG